MLVPLFGLGELGRMLVPLLAVENMSAAYEIARFVKTASSIVTSNARSRFVVVSRVILASML
jgi:hypothetical protein